MVIIEVRFRNGHEISPFTLISFLHLKNLSKMIQTKSTKQKIGLEIMQEISSLTGPILHIFDSVAALTSGQSCQYLLLKKVMLQDKNE